MYIWCKMRNFSHSTSWTEESLKHSHELLNFSFLLTEVDFNLFGLFCPAVPSLFACKIVKKVEK